MPVSNAAPGLPWWCPGGTTRALVHHTLPTLGTPVLPRSRARPPSCQCPACTDAPLTRTVAERAVTDTPVTVVVTRFTVGPSCQIRLPCFKESVLPSVLGIKVVLGYMEVLETVTPRFDESEQSGQDYPCFMGILGYLRHFCPGIAKTDKARSVVTVSYIGD